MHSDVFISPYLKQKQVDKILAGPLPEASPGETVVGVFWATAVRPFKDALIVTTHRVISAYSHDLPGAKGFKDWVAVSRITGFEISDTTATLRLTLAETGRRKYCTLKLEDREEALGILKLVVDGYQPRQADTDERSELDRVEQIVARARRAAAPAGNLPSPEPPAAVSEPISPDFADAPFAAPPPDGGLVDEIERLAALRERGLLDEDEFRLAKSKLLA